MIAVRVDEETLGHQLVAAGTEIVPYAIATAHVHPEGHIVWGTGDCLVFDVVDMEIGQLVGIAAKLGGLRADARVVKVGPCHLVELDIAAAGLDQLGRLLLGNGGEIREEHRDLAIEGFIGAVVRSVFRRRICAILGA